MREHGSTQCSSYYNIYQEECIGCVNRRTLKREKGHEKTFLDNDGLRYLVDVVRPCRARSQGVKTWFFRKIGQVGKHSLCKKDDSKKCNFQIDNPSKLELALRDPYGTSRKGKSSQRVETRNHLENWHRRNHGD